MMVARFIAVVFTAILLLTGSRATFAQFEVKELIVGELSSQYSATGAERHAQGARYMLWPAVNRQQTMFYNGLWIAVKNFTDADGRKWPAKVAHVTAEQTGQFFTQRFDMISRFEPPIRYVDGFETFVGTRVMDDIDQSIEPARMIINEVNSVTGISMTRKILAFSQEYHDSYHIIEYTFTNTGNTDGDDEVELPNQTMKGVYFFFVRRAIMPYGGARPIVSEFIGDGQENYETDLRALIQWQANIPGGNGIIGEADPLGFPVFNDSNWQIPEGDSLGRLGNPLFTGTATLHADRSASNEGDDLNQPSTTGYFWPENPYMGERMDAVNETAMQRQYEVITKGHMYPDHADLVDQDGDFTTADGDPKLGHSTSPTPMFAYGPYTLEPGENVRIVLVEAANGYTREEAMIIGREYKRLETSGIPNAAEAPIEYDANSDGKITDIDNPSPSTYPFIMEGDERMGKNDWFYTIRDSLMKVFMRARANYESGYAIPEPPLPPKEFRVISGPNNITLEWDLYPGANPNGFEIYRGADSFRGAIRDNYSYELIAELGPEADSYIDKTAVRGIDYYYYMQVVGQINNDPTGMTPTGIRLKSNRYYTQTYLPANLKRPPPPGGDPSKVRIVPNPYNIASDDYVRWPGEQDQLAFLDIPGKCTIRIYTPVGQLIKSIEHTDGTGDEFWNLTTEDRQVIASGVYVAVIDNHKTGERAIKKFVVIR